MVLRGVMCSFLANLINKVIVFQRFVFLFFAVIHLKITYFEVFFVDENKVKASNCQTVHEHVNL